MLAVKQVAIPVKYRSAHCIGISRKSPAQLLIPLSVLAWGLVWIWRFCYDKYSIKSSFGREISGADANTAFTPVKAVAASTNVTEHEVAASVAFSRNVHQLGEA